MASKRKRAMVYAGIGVTLFMLSLALVYLYTPLGVLAFKGVGIERSSWDTERYAQAAKFIVIG